MNKQYFTKIILSVIICAMIFSVIPVFSEADGSDITVIIDGKELDSDVSPVMESDRILLPVRAVFEGLGIKVDWDEKEQKVTGTKDNAIVILFVGKTVAKLNNTFVTLDAPVRFVSDRTLVPLRFIAESFGAEVSWIEEKSQVNIETLTKVTDESKKPGDDIDDTEYNYSDVVEPDEDSFVKDDGEE